MGMKSWFFAGLLIERMMLGYTRALCVREVQKSIKNSVKQLLEDTIERMGLGGYFEIVENEIRHKQNKGFIVFTGMQNHTADSVKSFEGFDIVWWEEAQNASKRSLDLLRPTIIRKASAEMWFSWNPEFEEDAIEGLMRGPQALTGVKLVHTTYEDNPYLDDEVIKEIENDKIRDPKGFAHIWIGDYKQVIEGAIFADEILKATQENRITTITPKAGIPVQLYFDLGQSDYTAIWFIQQVGLEYWVIDYYQASGQKMGHYFNVIAKKGYLYGEWFLPHDAEHEQLAAVSNIKLQCIEAQRLNPKLGTGVRIVPRVAKKALGIDAARQVLPQCYFDKGRTADGLNCLKRYAYAKDESTGRVSKEPKHDMYSHGADAFLQFAQNKKINKPVDKVITPGYYRSSSY